MSDTNIYINDKAPKILRDLLTEFGAERKSKGDNVSVTSDKADAIAWVNKASELAEKEEREIRKKCLDKCANKNTSWLMNLDAFSDKCFYADKTMDEPEPDYWFHSYYEQCNAVWDVRLCVNPRITQQHAITLAKGLVQTLRNIQPEEYQRMMKPEFTSCIPSSPTRTVPLVDDVDSLF